LHPSEAASEYLLAKFNRLASDHDKHDDIVHCLAIYTCRYWSIELNRVENGQSARLLLVWFKCFWWRYILQGLLSFAEVAIIISQILMLGYLSDYFIFELPSDTDTRNAYLYAMGLTLFSLAFTAVHAAGFHQGYKLGMMTRILMCSAIYQKILTLSQTVISEVTVGHLVNLASNDVHKFEQVSRSIPGI
jgi:ATP-binding cassette subfamily C (CFTR/MRP) protein 4